MWEVMQTFFDLLSRFGGGAWFFISTAINIFPIPHALDFHQLRRHDDHIDHPVIADADAIGVLRASQFPHELTDARGTFSKPAGW